MSRGESAGSGVGSSGTAEGARTLPLCVDLDGSLVATDTLWESLLACARTRPLALLQLPGWLLAGRSGFKRRLAALAVPDPEALPYREEVVAYLREARAAGRPVVLASATDRAIAESVANHLGLFSAVMASDGEHNLKGAHKRAALEAAYGAGGFEYLGDSRADMEVWSGAGRASCVGLSVDRRQQVETLAPIARHFDVPRPGLETWRRALRVHQWVKNALVFVPLLLAHRQGEPALLALATLAFVCLSLLASAVYVLNDLMDLPSDRAHPTKRQRPFAAGTLPIWSGVLAAPLLIGASLGLSIAFLPWVFTATLLVYLALNVIYTGLLRQVAMADVVFLAGLYSLRVLAGGYATGVDVSPWLIAFSLFFFLNLAFVKRYADLRLMAAGNERRAAGSSASADSNRSPGRDYLADDAPLLLALGPVSGYMATLVLALYITSEKVTELYRLPVALWLLIPLLVFWISRFWLVAQRGGMHEDPVMYILRDRLSYAVMVGAGLILIVAALVQG